MNWQRAAAAGAAGATAGVLLTPAALTFGLGFVGFSATGPIVGSLAALAQSAIGNVAAGSLFATAQSIAMGGAIPGVLTAVGAGVGAAATVAAAGAGENGAGEDDEDTAATEEGDDTGGGAAEASADAAATDAGTA